PVDPCAREDGENPGVGGLERLERLRQRGAVTQRAERGRGEEGTRRVVQTDEGDRVPVTRGESLQRMHDEPLPPRLDQILIELPEGDHPLPGGEVDDLHWPARRQRRARVTPSAESARVDAAREVHDERG